MRETKTNEIWGTKFVGKINNDESQLAIVSVREKKEMEKMKKKKVVEEKQNPRSIRPLRLGNRPTSARSR